MITELLNIGFDLALFLEKFILIIVVVSISLGIAMYSTWGERKVAAALQDRPGPNACRLVWLAATGGRCHQVVF
jgi:NADH:ubiquinone oxidoreductase subunit H